MQHVGAAAGHLLVSSALIDQHVSNIMTSVLQAFSTMTPRCLIQSVLRHCKAGKSVWTLAKCWFIPAAYADCTGIVRRAGSGPDVGQALIPQQAHLAKAGAQAATEPDV